MDLSKREQIYRNADTAPVMYVNSVQLGRSPFDIRLRFGVLEEADPQKVITNVLATIYMSPQHAKVFLAVLTEQIRKYEEENAYIHIPEAVKEHSQRE